MPEDIIYLDRQQCEDFNIEYFKSCSTALPADLILRSKTQGYDSKHINILKPLGREVIKLERSGKDASSDWDSPGWYRIIEKVSMS
jgi:hypothetical protein|tara:strand:- start:3762 stop:4019 length:258 start_codon:yes stop_codon:yes gene_type:complete